MMKFRKSIFASISLLMLAFVPKQAFALGCFLDPLECIVFDHADIVVTPLPIFDPDSEANATLVAAEEVLNNIASLTELIKYIEKLQKLAMNPLSLAQAIVRTQVPELESAVNGAQTAVDGFRSSVSELKGTVVNFGNEKSTQKAITKAAIVANPTNSAEELSVNEQREAFIQQALIDLHSDVLVAKGKLLKLKEADKQSQDAASTADTVGNSNIVIQMKSFENQVQTLEEKVASMRIVLEGIRGLRSAGMMKEDIFDEEKKDTVEGEKND